jgi:hypothetical protein
MSVTYTVVLEASEDCVLLLSALTCTERERRGTRRGSCALGIHKQAALVLRRFLEGARMSALARNIAIGTHRANGQSATSNSSTTPARTSSATSTNSAPSSASNVSNWRCSSQRLNSTSWPHPTLACLMHSRGEDRSRPNTRRAGPRPVRSPPAGNPLQPRHQPGHPDRPYHHHRRPDRSRRGGHLARRCTATLSAAPTREYGSVSSPIG